jgi:hypothetical protein
MFSRLTSIAAVVAMAMTSVPTDNLHAQSGRPPAAPPTVVRGCQMVLNARNTGSEVVVVDVSASQAQEGTMAWRPIDGGAINQASAMTFTLPANAPSTRHTFTTWIDCNAKQRYKFSVRRGTKAPVMMEFPTGGAYTTDVSMRLGDLAGP